MARSKRAGYHEQSRDFGGRGKIKCAMCGKPIAKHKNMAFCIPTKPTNVVYLEDKKQRRRK